MDKFVWDFLVDVWVLLSPFVAASIVYWFSQRGFVKERWWDRKAKAYADIIEGLVTMKYSADRWWEEEIYLPDRPPEVSKAINDEYRKARAQIERAAIVGDYIISREAAEALSQLIQRLEERGPHVDASWFDSLEAHLIATRICLDLVRRESRRDLGVEDKRHWRQRKPSVRKKPRIAGIGQQKPTKAILPGVLASEEKARDIVE